MTFYTSVKNVEHVSTFWQFVSNSPVFLKYPNYLADSSYDDYSGFEWYYAAEIYGQFSDGCEARRGGKDVGNIDAWSRIRQGSTTYALANEDNLLPIRIANPTVSQFLPWMEIGTSSPYWNEGYLLTHAMSRKLPQMQADVPNDLLKWIVDYDQKVFLKIILK